jgi:hypothetical protein
MYILDQYYYYIYSYIYILEDNVFFGSYYIARPSTAYLASTSMVNLYHILSSLRLAFGNSI